LRKKFLIFFNISLLVYIFIGSLTFAAEVDSMSISEKKILELLQNNHLEEVDFNYVKRVIKKGNRTSADVILIDVRPEIKYQKGTIPTSINIPDTKFEEYFAVLKDIPLDKELIVYCASSTCTKSVIIAQKLKEKGFSKVKVYLGGEAQWKDLSYLEIDTSVIKVFQEKNSALIVDSRLYSKFLQETILGAISIPDTNLNKLIGRFPINKNEKIVVFCENYSCEKSHDIANRLVSLDYKEVMVYSAGFDTWKKEGLPTTLVNNEIKK
jgi:rhodanese-related sulfurtransferase